MQLWFLDPSTQIVFLFWPQGCYKELDEWLTSHAGIVYGIVFGFTAVQVSQITSEAAA